MCRQRKRAELADDQAMNTIATLNTQHRELQKKIAQLYKVIEKFRHKYPRSGIHVPKKTAMLLDFDDESDDNNSAGDENDDGDDNNDDVDDDNDEKPKVKKANAKAKAKGNAKAAQVKKQTQAKGKSAATVSKKRKNRADADENNDDDATQSDEGDLSLSPVARAPTPALTRSAIRRNAARGAKKPSLSSRRSSAKATPIKSATTTTTVAAAAASKKASGNKSATKSNEVADKVASDDRRSMSGGPDRVVKITSKYLAYDLPIYHVVWSNKTTSYEFACDLNFEGYSELLSKFEANWGTRPALVLNPTKWPRNHPVDGVVAEKITDIGYCKGDVSVLVKWVGLPQADSTWERVTDMMVYGFGDLVNAFRKQWGDRPIENVQLRAPHSGDAVDNTAVAGITIKTESSNRATEQVEAAKPVVKRGSGRPRKVARKTKDTDATASSSVASNDDDDNDDSGSSSGGGSSGAESDGFQTGSSSSSESRAVDSSEDSHFVARKSGKSGSKTASGKTASGSRHK